MKMINGLPRERADRCPGVLRPWIADDGALVRLRLIGGRLSSSALSELVKIAADHADECVYLTKRANVQLRAIAHVDQCVTPDFVTAVEAAGMLPSRTHELVRNVMVSPLSGHLGGRVDMRPVARRYDELMCSDPELAGLSGRFLVVLDDGRGDLVGRSLDLGAVAVGPNTAQLRVGNEGWGEIVAISDIPEALIELARQFLVARETQMRAGQHEGTKNFGGRTSDSAASGHATASPWHVDELQGGGAALLRSDSVRDRRTIVTSPPPPFGDIVQDDGRIARHIAVPEGCLTPDLAAEVLRHARDEVIVTPWRSLLLPDLEPK